MQNPKSITVFAANCRGNPANCLYPNRIEGDEGRYVFGQDKKHSIYLCAAEALLSE